MTEYSILSLNLPGSGNTVLSKNKVGKATQLELTVSLESPTSQHNSDECDFKRDIFNFQTFIKIN